MAKKALTGLSAAMLGVEKAEADLSVSGSVSSIAPPPTPAPTSSSAQIALTLKVSPEIYERLKLFGARRRMSNQAILSAALAAYLDREP